MHSNNNEKQHKYNNNCTRFSKYYDLFNDLPGQGNEYRNTGAFTFGPNY